MNTVYGSIIKHKFRTAKGIIRHFWPSLLGLLLGIAFLGRQLLVVAMGGGIGKIPEPKYAFYVLCACVLMNVYRLFIKSTPAIRVNAATLHYLYHTPYFKRILAAEYLWSFIKNALAALLLAGFMAGFRYDAAFAVNALLLCAYLYAGILLSWIRYHGAKRERHLTVVCCIIASIGLLVDSQIVRLIFVGSVVLCAACCVFFRLRHLDLGKYRRDLAFVDINTSVASQFDLAQMSQIAKEHNANRNRRLFLFHFPLRKNNAVFYKCLIEILRAGNRIWIILLVLLLIGVLIYRTPLFSAIPVIGEPATASLLSVLLIMTTYMNVGEMLEKQLKTLLEKRQKGLFLPVGDRVIVLSYIMFGSLVYIALTVVTGFLIASKAHIMLLFAGLYIPTAATDMLVAIKLRRFRKPVQMVIRILSFMLGYLFVA